MEIGSFIELSFPKGTEHFKGDIDVARLNSGRAAIFHAMRLMNCNKILIPLYQCDTVKDFLLRKNVEVKTYLQDESFTPLVKDIDEDTCILLVNYFGIMSNERMCYIASMFPRVIIDNSQAFFARPIRKALNIYSPRKFVGVPDGAYVIGNNAERLSDEYEECFSSDTSLFLLQRIEYGCEGRAYESRQKNEERIDNEDIMRMSKLTRLLLDGFDYEAIEKTRKENFKIACDLFNDINGINPLMYYDDSCVPMIYPLYMEDDQLMGRLLEGHHFQGRWWNYILSIASKDSFEYRLSRYMIPITIDQRYGYKELLYVRGLV